MKSGKNPVVVKIGGELLEEKYVDGTAGDCAKLAAVKPLVIVHGGGKQLNSEAAASKTFSNGLRVTDLQTIALAQQVFLGPTKTRLMLALLKAGCKPVGLSGRDNAFVKCTKIESLGFVGKVESVDSAFLRLFLSNGFTPVVTPLGIAGSALVNVNADELAASIANALKASLVFLTPTGGVLVNGIVARSVSANQADELVKKGMVSGGMSPKLLNGIAAAKSGLKVSISENLFEAGTEVKA